MARELTAWLAGTALACGLIGAAFLPPRGGRPVPRSRRSAGPPATAARLEARTLSDQWQSAALALRLARFRQALEPEIARRRVTGAPSVVLLVEAPDSLRANVTGILQAELDSTWTELGLGVTKVSVGLVVDLNRDPPNTAGTPALRLPGRAHLLPDSTDRSVCMGVVPGWWQLRLLANPGSSANREDLRAWLANGLGPCAFYARYGVPGRSIRHWLTGRQLDLASSPSWGREIGRGEWADFMIDSRARRWWWDGLYQLPRSALACLAGRADGCRAAIRSGDVPGEESRLVAPAGNRSWFQDQRLVGGGRYLADVAREVGRDRFLTFWNSELPVDSALSVALREPVGKWTARWQRRVSAAPPLGASAPWLACTLGVLVAAGAVGGLILSYSRREVR